MLPCCRLIACLLPVLLVAADVTLDPGDTQAFSATVLDQFGQPMASQPTVTWTATGGVLSSGTGASTTYTAGTTPGSAWQISASTAGGLSDSRSIEIRDPTAPGRDPENPGGTVAGLDYAAYETGSLSSLPDFSTLTPVASGVADIPDVDVAPRADDYGLVFTGYLDVPADGSWTLFTTSDDGSALYIGTEEVVDNDGAHGSQERSGVIALKAGKHAIRVEYFEKTGGDVLQVRWQGPGTAKGLIPAERFHRLDVGSPPPPPPPPGSTRSITVQAIVGHSWSIAPSGTETVHGDGSQTFGDLSPAADHSLVPAALSVVADG